MISQLYIKSLTVMLLCISLGASITACDDEEGGNNARRRPTEAFDTTDNSDAIFTDTSTVDPDVFDPGQSGQTLFINNCSGCHGAEGEGTYVAPQVRNPVFGYASYVVRAGRDEMTEFAGAMPQFTSLALPDEALSSILTWLDEAPKPTSGQDLYLRFCFNCHGADARGGRVAVDVFGEIQQEPAKIFEIVREGHGGLAYGGRYLYMPAWSVSKITNAELSEISSYIMTLSP